MKKETLWHYWMIFPHCRILTRRKWRTLQARWKIWILLQQKQQWQKPSTTTGDGAAVFVNAEENAASTVGTSTFFAEAKLDREQARAKQKDMLTEMMNNENIDGEQKAACADICWNCKNVLKRKRLQKQ